MPRNPSTALGRLPARAVSFTRREPQPDRLTQLEAAVASIQKTLDVQFKRIAAMQAELDLLKATNGRSRRGDE